MTRRTDIPIVLRSPGSKTVVLPGESLTLQAPVEAESNTVWALEPRYDYCPQNWFPTQEVVDEDHTIQLTNTSDTPVTIKNTLTSVRFDR